MSETNPSTAALFREFRWCSFTDDTCRPCYGLYAGSKKLGVIRQPTLVSWEVHIPGHRYEKYKSAAQALAETYKIFEETGVVRASDTSTYDAKSAEVFQPPPPDLRKALATLDECEAQLRAQKLKLYRQSIAAPQSQKIGSDALMEMLAEDLDEPRLAFPITVSAVHVAQEACYSSAYRFPAGSWVAARLCNGDRKTYLGVLLGSIALSAGGSYDPTSQVLTVGPCLHNPAIWLPDAKQLVFGAECWWSVIHTPEELREITDADIASVWYVKALQDLSEHAVSTQAPTGPTT